MASDNDPQEMTFAQAAAEEGARIAADARKQQEQDDARSVPQDGPLGRMNGELKDVLTTVQASRQKLAELTRHIDETEGMFPEAPPRKHRAIENLPPAARAVVARLLVDMPAGRMASLEATLDEAMVLKVAALAFDPAVAEWRDGRIKVVCSRPAPHPIWEVRFMGECLMTATCELEARAQVVLILMAVQVGGQRVLDPEPILTPPAPAE